MEILGGDCDNPEHFSVEFTKSELTETEHKSSLYKSATTVYDGVITMKPGLPFGHYQSKITVRSSSKLEPTLVLPVKGQIFGTTSIICADYDKDTGILNMGRTKRGTSVTKLVMIRFIPQGSELPTFKITEQKPDWLNVTLGKISGEGASRLQPITIEIPANANLGSSVPDDPDNMAEIKIESNLKETPMIRIPIEYSVYSGQ